MGNEIAMYQHDVFMPVMNIEVALARREQLVKFTKSIMNEGTDYGKIPGTDKPTLLKPGAEKLVVFFGLAPVFTPTLTVQDWTGAEHGGEPLFYYRYKCELYRNGSLMATGEGSCSSRESKYRYRKADRVCPNCGQPAIIKGKAEYGGGWVCFKNRGGCNAKFKDNDPAITEQPTGRVPNPDVADLDNTILKMAQKRALIAAVLIGVNASEFFTQDLEDFVDSDYRVVDAPDLTEMNTLGAELYGDQWAQVVRHNCERMTGGKVKEPNGLNAEQVKKMIDGMKNLQRKRPKAAQPEQQADQQAEQKPDNAEPGQAPQGPQQEVDFYPDGEQLFGRETEPAPPRTSREQQNQFHAIGTKIYGAGPAWDAARHKLVEEITTGATTSSNDLTPGECNELMLTMLGKAAFGDEWSAKAEALCKAANVVSLRQLPPATVKTSLTKLQKQLEGAPVAVGK